MKKSRAPLAALAAALTLCSAAVATAAVRTDHTAGRQNIEPAVEKPALPRSPAPPPVGSIEIALAQVDPPARPEVEVTEPDAATSVCAEARCDPRQLAGTIVAFDGTHLTERTNDGEVHRALVDEKTRIACPPQQAVDEGRVFNPVPPTMPAIGTSKQPATPDTDLSDRYACSASELSVNRKIAGAAIAHGASGQLRWVGIALEP